MPHELDAELWDDSLYEIDYIDIRVTFNGDIIDIEEADLLFERDVK